jgi:hypothetical protein
LGSKPAICRGGSSIGAIGGSNLPTRWSFVEFYLTGREEREGEREEKGEKREEGAGGRMEPKPT